MTAQTCLLVASDEEHVLLLNVSDNIFFRKCSYPCLHWAYLCGKEKRKDVTFLPASAGNVVWLCSGGGASRCDNVQAYHGMKFTPCCGRGRTPVECN